MEESKIPRSLTKRSKASTSTIACPNCRSKNVSVASTRRRGDDIIRYKICIDCGYRHKTVETIADN